MSALPKSVTLQFHYFECWSCAIPYYLVDSKYRLADQRGDSFYCPNGHSTQLTTTALATAQKELETAKQEKAWAVQSRDFAQKRAKTLEASRNALKGVVTKTKNRVGNGVCPCCTRSFQNLKRHIAHKHPDYVSEAVG